MIRKRDIRKAEWYEECSQFFDIDIKLLKTITSSKKRVDYDEESDDIKEAREILSKRFMSDESYELYWKVRKGRAENDIEKSESWRDYIFACINGEKRAFQKINFYQTIIDCIVSPLCNNKNGLTIVDYGCGSSLFTRMVAQDFEDKIKTISIDVCKYAVDFSVGRNKIYNSNATGILIDDVNSIPELNNVDVILADSVFEHLPNSSLVIQGIINALSPGGVLIENYSGHSLSAPHKSDTLNSYKLRDNNLDMLSNQLNLLHGKIPKKKDGIYDYDSCNRYWMKNNSDQSLTGKIKRKLYMRNSLIYRVYRKTIK